MKYTGEILSDQRKNGKERPWQKNKTNSSYLSESFARLGKSSKAERVCFCGSTLKFNVCPNGHEKRLNWANFCRVRLCPMCSWRRSLLIAHQIKLVAHHAAEKRQLRWLFLTLTVRNCTGAELPDTINLLRNSWTRLMQRKFFKGAVVGWFRSLEVTRNIFENTYHPHYHVLLAVEPSYFSRDYIPHAAWVQHWQEALQVDYKPVVDIRTVKQGKRNLDNESSILAEKGINVLDGGAVAEMAKYATKAEDYLVFKKYKKKQVGDEVQLYPDTESGIDENKTDEVVSVLDRSLAHRRLLGYGGLLKEVWAELEAAGEVQDAEDEKTDLVHVEDKPACKCSVCNSNMLEELYKWLPEAKNYVGIEK